MAWITLPYVAPNDLITAARTNLEKDDLDYLKVKKLENLNVTDDSTFWQGGRLLQSIGAVSAEDITGTFPTPFGATPNVIAVAEAGVSRNVGVTVSGIGSTNFTARVWDRDANNLSINVAVQWWAWA